MPRPLHMHSALACHGGAARVMELLTTSLTPEGWPISVSCEEDDFSKGEDFLKSNNALPQASIRTPKLVDAQHIGTAILNEIEDRPEAKPNDKGKDKGKDKGESCLLHVHSTKNWMQLLKSLASSTKKPSTCITLHDANLITGGCIAPGNCKNYLTGCTPPCPLGFAGAALAQKEKIALLQTLDPVLVSPSNFLLKMAKKVLPELPITLIPNGVEENPFTKQEARQELNMPASAQILLFVAHGGSHALGKGGASWQRIWQQIKSSAPNTLCFMIGGDSLKKSDNLMELPYLPRVQMQKFMAAADILVYPSLAENHPLVILEAMAAGTVPCAYNVGGIKEQIQHEETGMLAPLPASLALPTGLPASLTTGLPTSLHGENALAAHVTLLLKNTNFLREIAHNTLQSYKKSFKVQNMTNRYISLYNSMS